MDETTMTGTADVTASSPEARAKLYGALAKLQANVPKVAKASTADAGTYKYQYAGLDAVTDAAMPALGRFGLAFVALPTLNDEGKFVLAYSLVHEAGGEISGEYPLPDKGSPQQLGSAITYARRYTLCAATGIAPGGDDDDAAAAEQAYEYSGSPRQQRGGQQRPAANTRQDGNGQRGQVSRPAAAQPPAGDIGEPDEAAQEYADQAHEARTLTGLEDIHKRAREAGKVAAVIRNPSTGKTGKLALYIDWRRQQLADVDKALRELDAAAKFADLDVTALPERVKAILGGTTIEDATPAELRQAAKVLTERAA